MTMDPSGVISFMAWLYSTDEHGNRFPTPASNCMRVKPTKTHALSRPSETDEAGERLVRDATLSRMYETMLTADERAVYDALDVIESRDKISRISQTRYNELLVATADAPVVIVANTTTRLGPHRVQVTLRMRSKLSAEQICERLRITPRQLRTRISAINRKKREAGC